MTKILSNFVLSDKVFSLINKLHIKLPKYALLVFYKTFIRPHLDFGYAVYDQANKESFSGEYNVALNISDLLSTLHEDSFIKNLVLYSEKGPNVYVHFIELK